MGLAERKTIAAIKDTDYKTFEAKIKNLCGFEVGITFDWAALENNPECLWICENKKYNEYMLDRIVTVFTSVCTDKMGKEAVREKLKSISLIPSAGEVEFKGGVLTVRNDLTGNGTYGAEEIRVIFEKGL